MIADQQLARRERISPGAIVMIVPSCEGFNGGTLQKNLFGHTGKVQRWVNKNDNIGSCLVDGESYEFYSARQGWLINGNFKQLVNERGKVALTTMTVVTDVNLIRIDTDPEYKPPVTDDDIQQSKTGLIDRLKIFILNAFTR